MNKRECAVPNVVDLAELAAEITTGAKGNDEQLRAFLRALEENMGLPCEATVAGSPVRVVKFDYDGNQRRGLTAMCRGADGAAYALAACDIAVPSDIQAERYLAAYRKWVGLSPFPSGAGERPGRLAGVLGGHIELAVLSISRRTAYCRLLGGDRRVTFRPAGIEDVVPGEIAVVRPAKQWTYAGTRLSGVIESVRLDARALGLVPLRLARIGLWNPEEHYWGEEGEPIEDWARPLIARGSRPRFEMEQVLPGADPEDPFSDPITESNDRKDSGDRNGAYKLLMDLCQADLRCLDAHSHLGNLAFGHQPRLALRHYEAGVRIGELSLGQDFDGVLPWGCMDNRPFLRCMHGFGLCLWRLQRFAEARRIFDRMLWLNPTDNQGVRGLIDEVRAQKTWKDRS